MSTKSKLLVVQILLLLILLEQRAYAQAGFDEFKKNLVDSEKPKEDFRTFKKELDKEYNTWLKNEREWVKITIDDETPQKGRLTPPDQASEKAKRPSHSRPNGGPLPKNSFKVSSGFGYRAHPIHKRRVFHSGIDFAAGKGTKIFASGDGKIAKAGVAGGYGNYILIQHAGQFKTAYAHLDKVVVRKEQKILRGEIIGYVGSSGRSTGPHLHYEVVLRNKKINPATFLVK